MNKTREELNNAPFIDMEDLRTIMGGDENVTVSMTKKFFKEIRAIAIQDLESKNMILPKRTIIPANYVWAYLKPYGIIKQ